WYMVQSGLVDDPRVSQLRLAAHLGLALLILAAMFWVGLSLLRLRPRPASPGVASRSGSAFLQRFARVLVALIFLQALLGALVAGTRAGFAYNTFPLMNGHAVPPGIMSLDPWYRNFIDNIATVQFDHRMIAWLLLALIPAFCWRVWRTPVPARVKVAAHLLLAALIAQFALGVASLLLVVPLPLAAAHQAGAVLLFAAALNAAHALRDPGRVVVAA
ncbi:MAG: COX15/CtaA family protein, partial [Casimicrobiaceae bacterium]